MLPPKGGNDAVAGFNSLGTEDGVGPTYGNLLEGVTTWEDEDVDPLPVRDHDPFDLTYNDWAIPETEIEFTADGGPYGRELLQDDEDDEMMAAAMRASRLAEEDDQPKDSGAKGSKDP